MTLKFKRVDFIRTDGHAMSSDEVMASAQHIFDVWLHKQTVVQKYVPDKREESDWSEVHCISDTHQAYLVGAHHIEDELSE